MSKRYQSIDGLRAYAAVSIVLLHVASNIGFANPVTAPLGNLVFLFMIISAFSMCCGYYEKVVDGKISFAEFYGKRFRKIWPFFALLCLIDLIVSPSLNSLYEVFANLTLCFGLLPNAQISVIGVGWFLGVVFAFYLLFPFFCYLISSKKRAWFSFAVALVFNYICAVRFDAGRTNIVYSAVFFLAGGLIYLYRKELSALVHKFKWLVFLLIAGMIAVFYLVSESVPVMLVLFSLMLIYILDTEGKYYILSNPVTKFISGISLEIYLSHMVIFRVLEKLKFTTLFENKILSFVFVFVATTLGTIAFVITVKFVAARAQKIWNEKIKIKISARQKHE